MFMMQFTRCLMILATVVTVALLAVRAYDWGTYAMQAIRYPFGIDYGEGIVWQQALMIPGKTMYGDITKYPYIVFHYPPLYHLVTRLVVALGPDWLAAGRGVSAASTLLTALASACLVYFAGRGPFGRLVSLVGGTIGGLVVLTHHAIIEWSVLMRVDMLSIALGLWGLLLCLWSFDRPRLLYAAVLSFVAAVYTKQTALVAPIAGIGPFLVFRPRQALPPILCGFAVAVVFLVALLWCTDGRFLNHIVEYNVNRFELRTAYWMLLSFFGRNALLLTLALAGVVGAVGVAITRPKFPRAKDILTRIKTDRSCWSILILVTYFALSSATLVALGKSGAAVNYTLEWLCACSLFVGLAFSAVTHLAMRPKPIVAALVMPIVPIVINAVLIVHLRSMVFPSENRFHDIEQQQQLVQLAHWIRVAPKPVLSDDMVLIMIAGKQVPLEPAIFTELSATGQWDERKELNLIRAEGFQFIVTDHDRGEITFDSRYDPAVADAIESAYPVKAAFGGYVIHLPRDSDCAIGPPLRCSPDMSRR
jgi:hypothetical protein